MTRILQPRWQLTCNASARRASTPALRGRLTCSTGATFSGGGQVPGARQPAAAGAGGRSARRGCCSCRRRTRRLRSRRRSRSAARTRRGRCRAAPTWPAAPVGVEHLDAVVFAVHARTRARRRRRRCRSASESVRRPCPCEPHSPSTAPAGESSTTRSLPVSATYTSPDGATATPSGWLNAPGRAAGGAVAFARAPLRLQRAFRPVHEHAVVVAVGHVQAARRGGHRDRARAASCAPPRSAGPPISPRNVPSPHRRTSRALPVSAT